MCVSFLSRISLAAGVSQDRFSQQRVGVPNLDRGFAFLIFLKRFCGQANLLPLSFSLSRAGSLLGLMRRSRHLTATPSVMTASSEYLWETVDHGNGNVISC